MPQSQQVNLPESGPEYYEVRRRIWLTPRLTTTQPPLQPSPAQQRLEEMLSHPNAVHSLEVWNNGLEKVWKGLCSGGKLKKRLPMNLIIKIIHASWLRDRTWPAGMQAPSSDEEAEQQAVFQPEHRQPLPSISSADIVESPSPSLWGRATNQYRTNRWR